jgi:integrase
VTGKTKTDARKRLNDLLRQRDAGKPVGDGNATVSEILDLWLKRDIAGRDLAPSTTNGYNWAAGIVKTSLGKRRVRTLGVVDVEDMLDSLTRDGFSHASLVKVRRALSQSLRAAERRGIATRNVAALAVLPSDAKRTSERAALTPEQLRTFLTALDGERLGPMYALMATLGLRPGEAAGLRWDAVDLDAGTVSIRTAMRLEGAKPTIVTNLKTRQARRTLTAPPVVVAMLRRHRHSQSIERLAATRWDDASLVFCTGVGTPLGPPNVRRDLDRIAATAGLPPITPNELRHSAASVLVDAGVPLDRVAQVLGHSSVRMLEQTYQHAVRPSIDIASGVMDSVLSAKEVPAST